MKINTHDITVFILDDHQILLDGIKSIIDRLKGFRVCGESNNGTEALKLISQLKPDIVLTDINMPGMNGIEFTQQLRLQNSDIKVIALSMYDEKNKISEMLHCGVYGYILKNTGEKELEMALTRVSEGNFFFSQAISETMINAMIGNQHELPAETPFPKLTDREKQIIRLVAQEKTNLEIGNELFISERTVESHRKNISRKTGTKTGIGLIKYAMEHNLLK